MQHNLNTHSALVVIPTTGKHTLYDALTSVVNQTHKNINCLVVIDGEDFTKPALDILQHFPQVKKMILPWNTGANGWYGHRIYYASGGLINEDFWFALDQDNWFEPNHVQTMIDTCVTKNLQWSYSLRKIYDADKTYICDDNCESLGKYPIYLNDSAYLVDTSSYCVRKEVFVKIASAWYSGWGGDRVFYATIAKYFPNFDTTKLHTSCYRLDGNEFSVNAKFFIEGNKIMQERHPAGFPWH